MFSAKFNLGNNFSNIEKTVNNFIKYIRTSFFKEFKIIKDSDTVEISSGKIENKSEFNIELVIKKVIPINEDVFNDRQELDKVITEIKNFCDSAEKIENFKYKKIINRMNHEN